MSFPDDEKSRGSTSKQRKKTEDLLENRVIPNIYAMRKTLESLAASKPATPPSTPQKKSKGTKRSKSSSTQQAIDEIMSSIEPFDPNVTRTAGLATKISFFKVPFCCCKKKQTTLIANQYN